ncbi:hypothetical protein niasHT_007486 [Heterodera trifolii]|uniref:Uncharacterized protein n=1 Tax=Heterodera trifolii TaxID=157864 RepID=A0ABD2LPA3_9BILA
MDWQSDVMCRLLFTLWPIGRTERRPGRSYWEEKQKHLGKAMEEERNTTHSLSACRHVYLQKEKRLMNEWPLKCLLTLRHSFAASPPRGKAENPGGNEKHLSVSISPRRPFTLLLPYAICCPKTASFKKTKFGDPSAEGLLPLRERQN